MKERIYNKTLNPELWDQNLSLKKDIETALLKIANDFIKDSGLNVDVQDILLLGSSANYNWTKYSDLDLHLLIDFVQLKMPEDYARKFTKSLTFRWNTEHNIKIKGLKVELYIQDINEINRSTGVYSIIDSAWRIRPHPVKIELDKHLLQQKYSGIVKIINQTIKEENAEKLKLVLQHIMSLRETGLNKVGEFSIENLIFKILRKRGIIKRLKDAINKFYDRLVSVKENLPREGYGAKDPKNDPKSRGKWTVDFQSDSEILK